MFYQNSDTNGFVMDSLGKIYDHTCRKDQGRLKEIERRIAAAEKRHDQGILDYHEREALKTEARALIFSDAPLYDRHSAVLFLLRAYFSRSLELAIRNGYEPEHPVFEKYARYFDRTAIPEDLHSMLNSEFPYIPGVIAEGDTYWRPKSS